MSDTKTVYKIDSSGEYIGDLILDDTDKSPVSGAWQVPANCVEVQPPVQEGYAALWKGNAWAMVEDHRGQKYWMPGQKHGDTPHEMTELGPLPEGATTTEPAETLDEAKAAKIAEFKSIRDAEEVTPIQTDKGLFDYDEASRDRLSIARQALEDNGGTGTITWTTADNQRVDLTVADFAAINGAAAVRSNTLHVYYNTLKDQVNACESVEAVNAIEWVDPL